MTRSLRVLHAVLAVVLHPVIADGSLSAQSERGQDLEVSEPASSSPRSEDPRRSVDPDGKPIRLRFSIFDPVLGGEPDIPAAFRSSPGDRLFLVQFDAVPTDADRAMLVRLGAEVVAWQPDDAYVVRVSRASSFAIAREGSVRWVGAYHPAYRLEPSLLAELRDVGDQPKRRYNLVVADKAVDKPVLIERVESLGGVVTHEQRNSILLEVELDGEQLLQVARLDEVLWIDRWTPPELDLDDARQQGGVDYLESQVGYTGAGLVGYVYEGVNDAVADFDTTPIAIDCGTSSGHGHATATIIFGNGTANPAVRGLAPDAAAVYTDFSCTANSRFDNVQTAMTVHGASFKTASWGNGRTTEYTSVSADTDDIIFQNDIAWTQSQSNAGTRDSRPQAWAKNVFSIGGFDQNDNADPSDDSWAAGAASIGPAADGRIKPTLSAYFRNIATASSTGGVTQFGGTSGATPMVSGYNALAIEMFARGLFPSAPQRVPGGTLYENRPHFTTLKALQVANAFQYEFGPGCADNRREHLGYGFPDLRTMYDNRDRMLIVDETDVLQTGQSTSYTVDVQPGDPELRVALNWSEPAANPASAQTIINDLSLRVTAPNGRIYWGNDGLREGNYSTSGGAENSIDTLECVFVNNPMVGDWTVEVFATAVVVDNHLETPEVDADYGLVISRGSRSLVGTLEASVNGGPSSRCDQFFGDGDTLRWDMTGPSPDADGQPAIVFMNFFAPDRGLPVLDGVTPGLPSLIQLWSGSTPASANIVSAHLIGPATEFELTVPSGIFDLGDSIRIQGLFLLAPGQNTPNGAVPYAESNVITFDYVPPPASGIVFSADNAGGGNAFNGGPAGAGFWQLSHGNPAFSDRSITSLVIDLPGTRFFDSDGNSEGAADGQFDHGNGACAFPNAFVGSDVTTGLVYAGTRSSACDPVGFTGWNSPSGGSDVDQVEFLFDDFQFGETFQFDADVDGASPENGDDMAGTTVTITLDDGSVLTGTLVPVLNSNRSEIGF